MHTWRPGMNVQVDELINNATHWKEEFAELRKIILDCGDSELEETIKWGQPCYSIQGKNIVLIHGFKEYCALLFFKGALLPDPQSLLVFQSEHVQASRQIRFKNLGEIHKLAPLLKGYVRQAVEIERSGAKIDFKKTSEFPIPEEFRKVLNDTPELKSAFESLTPGRQRAYLLFFASPKLSATRESRIAKHIPRILAGKGLND